MAKAAKKKLKKQKEKKNQNTLNKKKELTNKQDKPVNVTWFNRLYSTVWNFINQIDTIVRRQNILPLKGGGDSPTATEIHPNLINQKAPNIPKEQEILRQIGDISGSIDDLTQQLDSDLSVNEELLMQSMDRLDKISSPLPSVREAKKTQIRKIYKALDYIDKKMGRNN